MTATTASTPFPAAAARRKRRLGIAAVAAAVAVAAAGYGAYYALVLDHYESTDDAYVQGNVVQITPQVAGTVVAINADDTDFVKAGQPLVKLDRADAQGGARAGRGAARADGARGAHALRQQRHARRAGRAARGRSRARAEPISQARRTTSTRRAALIAHRARSAGKSSTTRRSQLANARSALAAAQAGVVGRARAARHQPRADRRHDASRSIRTSSAPRRKVREAYLALRAPMLPAPVDGYVAKRTVQVGQRVAPGAPLMSIVRSTRSGSTPTSRKCSCATCASASRSTLTADVYGKQVEYHGKVAGLGVGTGARSRCCRRRTPPATGSRSCSACRCASRSTRRSSAQHPLRVGLSMEVNVDVARRERARRWPTRRAARRSPDRRVQRRRPRRRPPTCRRSIAANSGARRSRQGVAATAVAAKRGAAGARSR